MKKTVLSGYMYADASKINPLQTTLTFIFTDFSPNVNKVAVPREEAANIIRTGLFQPVKVDYKNNSVYGHAESIPIGPITELFAEDDKIIGKAILWNEEFPELATYLKTESAEDKHVGFSWELFYERAEKVDDISWLHNCVVRAATIVETPAYGRRTPLLEIAEELKMNEEELQRKVDELTATVSTMTERISTIEASATQVTAERDDLATKLDEASTELEELRKFRQGIEAQQNFEELKKSRAEALTEAGVEFSEEDFGSVEEPGEFISMSEETFATVIKVANRKKSSKSEDLENENAEDHSENIVPDFSLGAEDRIDVSSIVKALNSL